METVTEEEIFKSHVACLLTYKFPRSLGFGRGSRVEGRGSRVEGTKSRVEGNMSTVEGNMSRVLKNENKIIKIKIKKK